MDTVPPMDISTVEGPLTLQTAIQSLELAFPMANQIPFNYDYYARTARECNRARVCVTLSELTTWTMLYTNVKFYSVQISQGLDADYIPGGISIGLLGVSSTPPPHLSSPSAIPPLMTEALTGPAREARERKMIRLVKKSLKALACHIIEYDPVAPPDFGLHFQMHKWRGITTSTRPVTAYICETANNGAFFSGYRFCCSETDWEVIHIDRV